MSNGSAQTPEQQLREFLKDVRRVLQFIVDNQENLFPEAFVSDTTFQQQLNSAWNAVLPRFDTALQAEMSSMMLQNAGLTGPELDFKLSVFDRVMKPVRGVLDWLKEKLKAKPASWWTKLKEWLVDLLDIIDAILDSIDLPGIEPIKEMKEQLQKLLELPDEPLFE